MCAGMGKNKILERKEYAVLLYPFEEKESGKRKSKGSYDTAIRIALMRLREVLSDD